MKKLCLKHAESISAAKMLLIRAVEQNAPARFKAVLGEHIIHLSEVYWFVLHSIYNPGLPFDADTFEADLKELHKDHSHGPAAKPE